jgi:hypothetical protein
MTSAVFDFEDIHKRMLGDRKLEPVCAKCEGGGWIEKHSAWPPQFELCPHCHNIEGHPCP